MIEYRSFHNSDPPQIVNLWNSSRLGRGAADGITVDAFETLVFAQPYFDPQGFIVACDGPNVVGFVHAGFGVNEKETGLARESGVLCAVLVHPDYRRRGIGRELVARAERSLHSAGVQTIIAGPASPRDPFYVGLYGGSRPAGFLESDVNAAPFFQALGYAPVERHLIFQRHIDEPSTPMNFRLLNIRRKMELAIAQEPESPTWWWSTRFGRLDVLRFLLAPKGGASATVAGTLHVPTAVAGLTVVGLDLYLRKWQQRAVGVIDLSVAEGERRKGYGQALVIEVCRRLRDELVTLLEAHAAEEDAAAIALFESTGFQRVDAGVVYQRKSDAAAKP